MSMSEAATASDSRGSEQSKRYKSGGAKHVKKPPYEERVRRSKGHTQRRAAVHLQAAVRMKQCAQRFEEKRKAATRIQARARGMVARRRGGEEGAGANTANTSGVRTGDAKRGSLVGGAGGSSGRGGGGIGNNSVSSSGDKVAGSRPLGGGGGGDRDGQDGRSKSENGVDSRAAGDVGSPDDADLGELLGGDTIGAMIGGMPCLYRPMRPKKKPRRLPALLGEEARRALRQPDEDAVWVSPFASVGAWSPFRRGFAGRPGGWLGPTAPLRIASANDGSLVVGGRRTHQLVSVGMPEGVASKPHLRQTVSPESIHVAYSRQGVCVSRV